MSALKQQIWTATRQSEQCEMNLNQPAAETTGRKRFALSFKLWPHPARDKQAYLSHYFSQFHFELLNSRISVLQWHLVVSGYNDTQTVRSNKTKKKHCWKCCFTYCDNDKHHPLISSCTNLKFAYDIYYVIPNVQNPIIFNMLTIAHWL